MMFTDRVVVGGRLRSVREVLDFGVSGPVGVSIRASFLGALDDRERLDTRLVPRRTRPAAALLVPRRTGPVVAQLVSRRTRAAVG
ncbi:MAG: hypothetical protein QM655_00250 [Nocardioidaceae bacterium]